MPTDPYRVACSKSPSSSEIPRRITPECPCRLKAARADPGVWKTGEISGMPDSCTSGWMLREEVRRLGRLIRPRRSGLVKARCSPDDAEPLTPSRSQWCNFMVDGFPLHIGTLCRSGNDRWGEFYRSGSSILAARGSWPPDKPHGTFVKNRIKSAERTVARGRTERGEESGPRSRRWLSRYGMDCITRNLWGIYLSWPSCRGTSTIFRRATR